VGGEGDRGYNEEMNRNAPFSSVHGESYCVREVGVIEPHCVREVGVTEPHCVSASNFNPSRKLVYIALLLDRRTEGMKEGRTEMNMVHV